MGEKYARVIIEKELTNPVTIDGYAEVLGPYYHIYKVDDEGSKTLVKTVAKDIREAAREAERMLDLNVLEVAYQEKPDSFKSSVDLPPSLVKKWKNLINNGGHADIEEGCVECQAFRDEEECSKHYF